MRKVFIFITLLIVSQTVNAQWREIANFVGHDDDPTNMIPETMTCVYFLDLHGPPRIGFVGTETELYKTTDGGKNWHSVWDSGWSWANYYVTDVCFKDSLMGWFTVFGNRPSQPSCYRTSDGGETWNPIKTIGDSTGGNSGIYYVSGTNRLLLTPANYLPLKVSTDLGDTWSTGGNWVDAEIAFLSPLNGIVTAGELPVTDSLQGYNFITSDGGLTWDSVFISQDESEIIGKPMPVPGTSTYFSACPGRIVIRRSDDYGRTWRILKDFGPFVDTTGSPSGLSWIAGDISRLYISTDSGFYVSIDSGVTWTPDGGPPTWYSAIYAAHGVTIAGAAATNGFWEGAGLWEEDWPQSGVAQNPTAPEADISVFPNPTTGLVTIRGVDERSSARAVEVTNVLGESVMRNASPVTRDGQVELDLSKLPAGTYFARIETANGIVVRKILKE